MDTKTNLGIPSLIGTFRICHTEQLTSFPDLFIAREKGNRLPIIIHKCHQLASSSGFKLLIYNPVKFVMSSQKNSGSYCWCEGITGTHLLSFLSHFPNLCSHPLYRLRISEIKQKIVIGTVGSESLAPRASLNKHLGS